MGYAFCICVGFIMNLGKVSFHNPTKHFKECAFVFKFRLFLECFSNWSDSRFTADCTTVFNHISFTRTLPNIKLSSWYIFRLHVTATPHTTGSWTRLIQLAQGNPTPFVLLFTLGNIVSVLGSFFLNGPYNQARKMVGPEMRCATGAYLTAMGLTFFVAYTTAIKDEDERLGLIVMLIVVQYVCMVWFIICSVYFLKRMVQACIRGTCHSYCPQCMKACGVASKAAADAKVGGDHKSLVFH